MSIYWRKQTNLPDTELPQAIMRPFWHPTAEQLDDKQFKITLPEERPVLLASMILTLSISAIIVAFFILYELFLDNTSYRHNITADTYNITGFALLLILAAVGLLFIFSKIIQKRSLIFDRQSHSLNYPKKGIFPRFFEDDYDTFTGKIIQLKSPFGRRLSILALENQNNSDVIYVYSTYKSPQSLAGYWSFIVQYMKPDAPLPDVPLLHDYPNTTPGVLQKNTIDYS